MSGFFAMLIPVEIVYIAIIFLLAWFWLNSMQARDTAVTLGRQAAERYGLQLLDETVEIRRLWAARDTTGRLRFVRTYAFEVSDTGTHRLSCSLTLLGGQLEQLDIPPHRETIH